MAGNTTSDWTLPLDFYFNVEFQSKFDRFTASFTEVSGLGMKITGDKKMTDIGVRVKMPGGVTYDEVTLKRPAQNDLFAQWVRKCLKADANKVMVPYDMIIKLLDKEGNPAISWMCSHAFPTQWTLGSLNAEQSALAMETIVISCNRIDNIKP